MPQDPQPVELSCRRPLESGLAYKPPIPQYTRKTNNCLEKLIHINDKYLDNNMNDDDILFGKLFVFVV
jgi:hypothetical protein